MDNNSKVFEAADVICLNCIENTLEDNSICEHCPVRKLVDYLNSKMKNGE